MIAVQYLHETFDRFFAADVDAGQSGKHLTNEEWLCQEALDLASARNRQLILVRKLFNAENCDYVLQVLVTLQYTLDAERGGVVVLTHYRGFQNPRVRRQRINRREECLRGERTFERYVRVQVTERRHDAGVGIVVCRHVDGLERCYRAGLG